MIDNAHIYHYHIHSEKRYFLGDLRGLYDVIALNGNIVANTPAGVAGLLTTANKAYYIDPQTYAFQHSTIHIKKDMRTQAEKQNRLPTRYEFKPSIKKLAESFLGEPFLRVIEEDRPLIPEDITKANIVQVCESIIRFQRQTINDSISDDDREFLGSDPKMLPALIISPYFFLDDAGYERWFPLNIEMYRLSKEIETEIQVYLPLILTAEMLEEKYSGTIIDEIGEMNPRPDGILLWINDLNEAEQSESVLRRYKIFAEKLKNVSGSILNIHGGFLSLMLSHRENRIIDGVAHGINYGEHRAIRPVGGGIPFAWYYSAKLHTRIRFGDAVAIIKKMGWNTDVKKYFNYMCGCKTCVDLLNELGSVDELLLVFGESMERSFARGNSIVSMEFPTANAKKVAAEHYLHNKKKEYDDLGSMESKQILESMRTTLKEFMDRGLIDYAIHLNRWVNLFGSE